MAHKHKTWDSVDFTIYFSFIKWWVILAVVLEIIFRFWAGGLGIGLFFEQMEIPKPDYNLDITGLSHGAITGRMLEKIQEFEKALKQLHVPQITQIGAD